MSGFAGPPGEEGWMWREIGSLDTTCGPEDFISGLEVWVKRPQVVNRRLLGAALVKGDWDDVGGGSESVRTPYELRERVFLRELLPRAKSVEPRKETVTICHDLVQVSVTFDPVDDDDVMSIKSGCGSYRLDYYIVEEPHMVSLSIFEPRDKNSVPNKSAPYSTPNGVTTPTPEWLHSVLLQKVVQWSEESEKRRRRGGEEVGRVQQSLVPLSRYCSLYRQLRNKYGPPLIQNWPEATDPHKFVYEDIAIATYLILLWEREREEQGLTRKQSFVDLGCGNGLLVYLLTSEGYTGKGIDLRRRKIWSYYGDRADLEVCSLTPSDLTLFPQFDWLIGNHSDELTPWIPLMAARSSYRTRYFVLPCCPHDFDSKFRRPDTTKSQYSSYLDYIRHVGETVGFKVREDTLRIPSSKRVCHVGQGRWYAEEEEEEMERKRERFLRERCCRGGQPCQRGDKVREGGYTEGGGCVDKVREGGGGGCTEGGGCVDKVREGGGGGCTEGGGCVDKVRKATEKSLNSVAGGTVEVSEGGGGGWAERFVPRSATEQTRNCSRVDRTLQLLIVQTLTSRLLEAHNWITIPVGLPTSTTSVSPTTPAGIPTSNIMCQSSYVTLCDDASLKQPRPPAPKNTTNTSSRSSTKCCGHFDTARHPPQTPKSTINSFENSDDVVPLTADNDVAKMQHDASSRHCDPQNSIIYSCESCDEDVIPVTADDVMGNHDTAAGEVGRQGKLVVGEVATSGGNGEATLTCEDSHGNPSLWNLGGRLSLPDAARLFDGAVLKQLKQECGGLQTLLRNHHQVFTVGGGFVQLRNWAVVGPEHGPRRPAKQRSVKDAKRLVRTKPCWFHYNHPQGCPRRLPATGGDHSCPYAHSSGDLRQRPDFNSPQDTLIPFPFL